VLEEFAFFRSSTRNGEDSFFNSLFLEGKRKEVRKKEREKKIRKGEEPFSRSELGQGQPWRQDKRQEKEEELVH
jgi:hypothetical protein